MHPNFHFSAVQILWTLTFAAQLVLLVVLLGRDRIRQFPWFTLSIALMALRLLASRLLYGRMAPLVLSEAFIIMADVAAIAGLLVVIEMARRAFVGLPRRAWLVGALVTLAIGGGVLAAWGPWPGWKTLTADSSLAVLRLMQLAAQKADTLIDLLTIELGIVVLFVGRRYTGGWRTHVQRVVIGLSTASVSQLAVQAVWQVIAKTAAPHSQAEYERILALRDRLFNANGALYVAVLVWWIICLWMDEPAAAEHGLEKPTPEPEYLAAENETLSGDATG